MKRPTLILGAVAIATVLLTVLVWHSVRATRRHSTTPNSQLSSKPTLQHSSTPPLRFPTNPSIHQSTNPAPVPASPLAIITGKAEPRYFRARLAAIGQLGHNLSLEDRQALYAYLRAPEDEKWLRPGQSAALKNEVLNLLREQESPPPELTGVLLALRRDEIQPLVLRDYALQHLAGWYPKTDASQQPDIVKELQSASLETSQSYAGTALLGLHRIRQENPAAELPSITDPILRLIDDPAANLLARITAVQLSGRLGLAQARDLIARVAADQAQPETLRLAAIGALTHLAGPTAQACLDQAAQGANERLKEAALLALKYFHQN